MKILLFSLLFLFGSCSSIKTFFSADAKLFEEPQQEFPQDKDFIEQLASLGDVYIHSPGISLVSISSENLDYLQNIARKIFVHNELFFTTNKVTSFYFIKSDIPFHFSLPKGQIFISYGLIKKFVRNEGELASIISYELVRSWKNLYRANIISPKNYISTEKIIHLLRIGLEQKNQVNEWVFYILKRSGFDPYAHLTWIQQQNRNNLEFSLHIGDVKVISQEEYRFKSFIISQNLNANLKKLNKNSSKKFYIFKNTL